MRRFWRMSSNAMLNKDSLISGCTSSAICNLQKSNVWAGCCQRKVVHIWNPSCSGARFYSAETVMEDVHESELRKKVGWLIKLLAAGTITYVSFNMYPLMGDSMIWQTVALVRSEDPFIQRSGASRICWIATDDRRKRNFVEAGGVLELLKMLEGAPDDKTRRGAVKALVNLCQCDVAVEALRSLGKEGLLQTLASESSDRDIVSECTVLLAKLSEQ